MAIIFIIMISFIILMTDKMKENWWDIREFHVVGIITKLYTTSKLSLWKRFSNAIHAF